MDLAPLIETGDWPAVAAVLDTLIHPQQEMKYRVELLVLCSLSCVTALIYICTFVHEVVAKRRTNQLWFFRFIDGQLALCQIIARADNITRQEREIPHSECPSALACVPLLESHDK